jgi:hypothetical protein
MWEWLNMMEMLNYPVLKREASREYRLYQVWTYEKTDIDEIMDVLLEHGVLDKSRTLFQYQEWFAQKAMVILENIRDMHKEHSAVRGSFVIPSSVS